MLKFSEISVSPKCAYLEHLMEIWVVVDELVQILILQAEESGLCRIMILLYLKSILVLDLVYKTDIAKIAPGREDSQAIWVILIMHRDLALENQDDTSAYKS